MKRYLITTADERSWVFDRPVLFLGEWCCRYDRKHIWSKMDAIVAEPFGISAEKKPVIFDYAQSIVYEILSELTIALNAFHQTQYDERYWNSVLGQWVRRYVFTLFNRYKTLEQALERYDISGTTLFESQHFNFAATDALSFTWACNDEVWNHVLFSRLLEKKDGIELNYISGPLDEVLGSNRVEVYTIPQVKFNIKRSIRNTLCKISSKFVRNSDAVIMSSYLPFKEVIKLQLCLKQMPQLWRSPSYKRVEPDTDCRSQLGIKHEKHEGVEQYIREHLFQFIPSCYLEGYGELVNSFESFSWPKKPKFIFTSSNFHTDDVFKAWAASKVNEGVPYYIGQHGNNYGTMYGTFDSPEHHACDKFLTWGWKNCPDRYTASFSKKYVPCFVFSNARKKGKFDPKGGVLLLEQNICRWYEPSDIYHEFGVYQEDQFRFVEALPSTIHDNLTVRLHHDLRDIGWFDTQRWQDRSPKTKLVTYHTPLKNQIENSRLVVHSYDSTSMLLTLSLDIPTLCFWNHGLDHLYPHVKPEYALLRKVGIIQDGPEQAAAFIAKHWDDLQSWWQNDAVQHARKVFCEQFARIEKKPIRYLKSVLLEQKDALRQAE